MPVAPWALALSLLLAVSLDAAAQDPRKDALVQDPAVRESLQPENTPLGRSPPSNFPAGSDPALQQAIDRSHEGSTGNTDEAGGTRRPPDQPPDLGDGQAPRLRYQPEAR